MLFVDPFFLLVFLPISLTIFVGASRLAGREGALLALVVLSAIFYAKSGLLFFAILMASIITNYTVGVLLISSTDDLRRRLFLTFGLAYNFGVLLYFKYIPYLLYLITRGDGKVAGVVEVVVPLGISFYTFHQAVFLMDVYARKPVVLE